MRYVLFCWLLLLMACNGRSRPVSALFPQDSGYLLKKEVEPFLIVNHLTDSTSELWRLAADTDTFGKYYRQPDGTVMACLMDLGSAVFATLLIMEINSYDSILKEERYIHWNYDNCWNGFDGFSRTDDYYFLKICGTGSAFSASHLFAFKRVTPQDSLHSITQNIWMSTGGCIRAISGVRQLNGDTLRMHYTVLQQRNTGGIPTPTDTTRFTIAYVNDRQGWHALDSTLVIKELYD